MSVTPAVPHPPRGEGDAVARLDGLTAAELELDKVRKALFYPVQGSDMGEVLELYVTALDARNALRDARP